MSTIPIRPHPDDEGHRRGRHIEDELLRRLRERQSAGSIDLYLQPDAVVLTPGGLHFIEAKGQDAYEPPPFRGHGLPVKQALRYQDIYRATGIATMFIVWDRESCWWQWLHVLEQGEYFDTAGTIKTPRRIYPLTSFIEAPMWRRHRGVA